MSTRLDVPKINEGETPTVGNLRKGKKMKRYERNCTYGAETRDTRKKGGGKEKGTRVFSVAFVRSVQFVPKMTSMAPNVTTQCGTRIAVQLRTAVMNPFECDQNPCTPPRLVIT